MYKRILVPLDGTFLENQVLQHARALARSSGAELILLRVVSGHAPDPLFHTPWVQAVSEEQMESLRLMARGALERIAHEQRAQHLRVSTHVYVGPTADAILDCARDVKADAIVMSALGVKASDHWLDADVTGQILHGAHVPVFLVGGSNPRPNDADSSDYAPL